MSATYETAASETAQPFPQPGSATNETVLLSVDEAAGIYGISPQAIRKRIKHGQLNARRAGRAWQVILDRATIATSETETAATDAQPRTKPGAQPSTLVAQQQADQMAALVASIQAPLLDRIEAANREAERERIARLAVEGRLEEALAEVELLREIRSYREQEAEPRTRPLDASPDAPGAIEGVAMTPDTLHRWSRVPGFARRLFGRS